LRTFYEGVGLEVVERMEKHCVPTHISWRPSVGRCSRRIVEANNVYLLEVLLQRYVYARPLELKKRKGPSQVLGVSSVW